MKVTHLTSVTVIGFALLAGCKSANRSYRSSLENSTHMQKLARSYSKLFAPDQKDKDEVYAEMRDTVHDIRAGDDLGDDPSVDFELGRLAIELRSRHPSVARITQACVACHTQSHDGRYTKFIPDNFTVSLADRTVYFLAVNDVDEAISSYLNQPLHSHLVPLQRVSLDVLAASVRVKRDPALARRLVNKMSASPALAPKLRASIPSWSAALAEWNADDSALHLVNRGLLRKDGRIEFLRASAKLHLRLRRKRVGRAYAENLYFAGLAEQGLAAQMTGADRRSQLDRASRNFEACIHQMPYSELGNKAFTRMNAIAMLKYKADDFDELPLETQGKLNELREVANPINRVSLVWGADR